MLEGGASFTARAAGVMTQFWPTNELNDIATGTLLLRHGSNNTSLGGGQLYFAQKWAKDPCADLFPAHARGSVSLAATQQVPDLFRARARGDYCRGAILTPAHRSRSFLRSKYFL